MPEKKSSQPQKTTLAKKLNITLVFIFSSGMILSGITLATLIGYAAYKQTLSKALILMSSLDAVQDYTAKEVKPQVQQHLKNKGVFPQAVPSYAAQKVFERLRQSENHSNFYYKSVMLNPNKAQNQTDQFEIDLVEKFRQNGDVKQLQGVQSINNEYFFYMARPLIVENPKSAPNKNEILGVQIVSFPLIQTVQDYGILMAKILGIIAIIFGIALLIINFWFRRSIIKSIKKIVQVAEAVSTGDMDAEFKTVSNDEIGDLVEAFTRMKMSLAVALEKFEQYRIKSRKPNHSRKIESEPIRPRLRE